MHTGKIIEDTGQKTGFVHGLHFYIQVFTVSRGGVNIKEGGFVVIIHGILFSVLKRKRLNDDSISQGIGGKT